MAKYVCSLITVSDIARSRAFYEGMLGQKVNLDLGPNVSFHGGFAIHERTHFESLLGDGSESHAWAGRTASGDVADVSVPAAAVPVPAEGAARTWGELYFEEDAIETIASSLRAAGVAFVHPLREQPWAQRVFRCLDPDGHMVEVGESLEATARRLVGGGMNAEAAAKRMGMPAEFVENALSAADKDA